MKKFSAKFVVSALAAAMMLSASAVSVSAIDYGVVTPTVPTPVVTTTTTAATTAPADAAGDDASDSDADTTAVAGVVTAKEVENKIADAVKAGKKEVTISVAEDSTTGKVTVQESAVADIAKSSVPVTFDVKPASGTSYSVTIDPKSITSAKSVNLGMQILTGSDISTAAAALDLEVPVTNDAIIIAPMMKGNFGMDLTVTLPASAVDGMDVDNAVLYYISDDGEITALEDALTVNDDGSVSITISHASAYVISTVDLTEDFTADIDEDDIDFDDDDDDSDVAASIDEDDKADDEPVVISGETSDDNPGTGVGLTLGAVAVSAVAVVLAKKRK